MAIASLQGWMLERAAELDEHRPGFAGHVLRASPERRQVIAAFLAIRRPCSDFRSGAEVGWFLCHANHDAILRAAFGTVPCGMRGALRRAGSQPHGARFYPLVHRLLTLPDPSISTVIGRLVLVDATRLRIVRLLPADMRQERIVGSLSDVRDALDLRSFVAHLGGLGVDRNDLIAAFAAAPSRLAYTEVARRWSLKVMLPPHPVPATETYEPVLTGAELRRIALHYRNCVRAYLTNILEHRSSFAVYRHGGEEAVVHLVSRHGRWWLEDLHPKDPADLSAGFILAAERYLAANAISRVEAERLDQRPDPLRRVLKHSDPERFGYFPR